MEVLLLEGVRQQLGSGGQVGSRQHFIDGQDRRPRSHVADAALEQLALCRKVSVDRGKRYAGLGGDLGIARAIYALLRMERRRRRGDPCLALGLLAESIVGVVGSRSHRVCVEAELV